MGALRDSEEAVSPVIGTVLILMITVLAIAAILSWGLPAIQGLQAHAAFQSTQTQMLELNQDLRNLRDPQNTRVVTMSIADGSLDISDGNRWVVMVGRDLAAHQDMYLDSWQDDATLVIDVVGLLGPTPDDRFILETAQGGKLIERDQQAGCASPCSLQLSGQSITEDAHRIQYLKAGTLQAEFWVFNAGRISFAQSGTGSFNHLEMGASIIQQGERFYMRQSPTMKHPDFDVVPEDDDFFVRVIQLSGTASQAGTGEFAVLVNLVDNYGVSRGRPVVDGAEMVRFQIDGDLEEPFCNYFLGRGADYVYDGLTADCGDGDANVLYRPQGGNSFLFEMSQAVVNSLVRRI